MVHIVTERLIIRDHFEEDFETMASLLTDKEQMRYTEELFCPTLQDAKDNLNFCIISISESPRINYFFRIETKPNEYVGEIGFDIRRNTEGESVAHLGYFSASNMRGKGYMSESVSSVIAYAFQSIPSIVTFTSGCLNENVASRKILEKYGFIFSSEKSEKRFHEGKEKIWTPCILKKNAHM